MLGQVFDTQLQLRLADLLFATQITQIVQRIAQGARLRFLFIHGGQSRASFFRDLGNSLARCFQLRCLTEDSRFRFHGFLRLHRQPALISRNITAARSDEISELRFARGHRLTMVNQTLVALPFRRHRESQLIQFFSRFLFLRPRIFAR